VLCIVVHREVKTSKRHTCSQQYIWTLICIGWSDVTVTCGHNTISVLCGNTAYRVKLSGEGLSRWVDFRKCLNWLNRWISTAVIREIKQIAACGIFPSDISEIWVCRCCCCCCSVHGSSFTLAARGQCRCINGELICAKPQYSSIPQQGIQQLSTILFLSLLFCQPL